MKGIVGVAAVFMALGAWAAFIADGSSSIMKVPTGLAIVIGCNLLFALWVWFRAKPGSGDRMVMPTVIFLSVAMLVGILPRLFWPGAERVHIAASIISLVVMAATVIMQIRRRRALRQSGPTL